MLVEWVPVGIGVVDAHDDRHVRRALPAGPSQANWGSAVETTGRCQADVRLGSCVGRAEPPGGRLGLLSGVGAADSERPSSELGQGAQRSVYWNVLSILLRLSSEKACTGTGTGHCYDARHTQRSNHRLRASLTHVATRCKMPHHSTTLCTTNNRKPNRSGQHVGKIRTDAKSVHPSFRRSTASTGHYTHAGVARHNMYWRGTSLLQLPSAQLDSDADRRLVIGVEHDQIFGVQDRYDVILGLLWWTHGCMRIPTRAHARAHYARALACVMRKV